jgi:hypothetical protein
MLLLSNVCITVTFHFTAHKHVVRQNSHCRNDTTHSLRCKWGRWSNKSHSPKMEEKITKGLLGVRRRTQHFALWDYARHNAAARAEKTSI